MDNGNTHGNKIMEYQIIAKQFSVLLVMHHNRFLTRQIGHIQIIAHGLTQHECTIKNMWQDYIEDEDDEGDDWSEDEDDEDDQF